MLGKLLPIKPRSARDIERSITHLDLDREIDRARGTRFLFDGERLRAVPVPQPAKRRGSFLTGTCTELIYSNKTPGTAKTTFTTETAGMGDIAWIPAGFFLPGRGVGQSLRVVARGIASVTGTPTWAWTFRLNPTNTPANPPTGPNIGSTGSNTSLTGVSNQLWEAELDVQMTVQGAPGNNSTLRGLGVLAAPGLFALAASQAIFGGGASPGTVATFDWSLLNTLTVGATCGTSSASNSVQLLQLLMFGLN
jgi:hypothetical protein